MLAYRSVPVFGWACVAATLLLALGGCGLSWPWLEGDRAATSAARRPETAARPTWRPGDRWVYSWTAAEKTGTKAVEVVGTQEFGGVSYYLVRIGDLDHFYTSDLHWAGGVRDQRVEVRMTPPQPWFTWPLEVGRRWTHRGTLEVRNGKLSRDDVFQVTGQETVVVPAGRFNTFKIVREGRTDQSQDEYWYAPEVRFYVKWVGRRGDQRFDEELRDHRPGDQGGEPWPTRPAPPAPGR
jgi:hypothetical protein